MMPIGAEAAKFASTLAGLSGRQECMLLSQFEMKEKRFLQGSWKFNEFQDDFGEYPYRMIQCHRSRIQLLVLINSC